MLLVWSLYKVENGMYSFSEKVSAFSKDWNSEGRQGRERIKSCFSLILEIRAT